MKTEKTNSGDKHLSLWVAFGVCLILYTVLMAQLFYRQTIHDSFGFQVYGSDIDAYLLEMQGLDSGFDFPYPVYFGLARLFIPAFGVETAAAISISILNTLAVVVLFMEIYLTLGREILTPAGGEDLTKRSRALRGFLLLFACFSMFFVSMLFAPKGVYLPGMDHKYLGVFSPNPYHNQTYFAVRAFSIAAMFSFARVMEAYGRPDKDKKEYIDYPIFSVWLLLSTLTKPSFTLVFGSMAFVSLMVRLIIGKGKNVKDIFLVGITFLPTIAVLLVQFGGVFGSSSHAGEDGGIGFGLFTAWKVYMTNIPLAIVLAAAFPLWMLIFNFKRLKDHMFYRFSMGLYLAGLLEFALLYEKGDRFIHLNFSWGYMHGLFFAFLASGMLLVENTVKKKQHPLILTTEWIAFLWHLLCGFIYFRFIYYGGFYYSFL
jgi:hypothetical protein